jgi:hypothetical protein
MSSRYARRFIDSRDQYLRCIDPRMRTLRPAEVLEYLRHRGWRQLPPDREGYLAFQEQSGVLFVHVLQVDGPPGSTAGRSRPRVTRAAEGGGIDGGAFYAEDDLPSSAPAGGQGQAGPSSGPGAPQGISPCGQDHKIRS